MFDMTSVNANYGVVDKEANPVLHRFGSLAGRSCCGKAIVSVTPEPRARFTVCRRCVVLDAARDEGRAVARDEGLPEWF